MVRDSIVATGKRVLSRGKTSFCHIGNISRGGPGMTATTLPFFSTHQPGAVPRGFGNDVEEEIRMACCILEGGISRPMRTKWDLSSVTSAESVNISSPSTSAIASRVRSSWVGPKPPVVIMTEERLRD